MSHELIVTARLLANIQARRPRQADLKRAVSTAYYALFHTLAKDCADRLIGTGVPSRHPAWRQVYRALDHGPAKKACEQVAKLGFPPEIVHFSDTFKRMQEQRHTADYDPSTNDIRADVQLLITEADVAIRAFKTATRRDRTAFAALVLLKNRQ